MPLYWNLSENFIMIRLGFWVYGRKTRGEEPFSLHHVKGTCSQHDIALDDDLDHLDARFLLYKVFPFSSFPYSLEGSHHTAHTQ